MLNIDPGKRFDIDQVLNHSFFGGEKDGSGLGDATE
jgi:hypothetical protein